MNVGDFRIGGDRRRNKIEKVIVEMEKRVGDKTEPWGTPLFTNLSNEW